MSVRSKLEAAGKLFGACARSVQSKSASPLAPTRRESELLIGLGIASEWVRRAAALEPLKYNKRLMNKSPQTPPLTELIRFTMAWSALNALFARPGIVRVLGKTSATSELDLFKFLIAKSGISASAISVHEQTLHSLLSSPVTSTVPGHPPGTTLPCLQVLHEKFTPTPYRTKGVGKKIQTAITTGSYAGLDLAAIIYSMRNWSLHGSAIGSSFRSVPRFKAFIATVLAALADVHHGIATELLKKV